MALASFWDRPARAMGQRRRHWEDVWAVDAGSPDLILNNATLLRPFEPAVSETVVHRLRDFYAAGPGGGYIVWDPWARLELDHFGFDGVELPCMIRPPGGALPPSPLGLEIVEAYDARSLAAVETALIEGLPLQSLQPPVSNAIWDLRVLGSSDHRLWAGLVDGRPVASAVAHISHGFVYVGFVATVPEMRGRGFGEALTWRATLADPSLPAVLHASASGRALFERMGFASVAMLKLWFRERRD